MPRTKTAPAPAIATTRVDPEALEILRTGLHIDGNRVQITAKLARPLYVKVNEVLEMLGGKWNRAAKAHLFEEDAQGALEDVIKFGEYVDLQKQLQFFETPPVTADKVVARACANFVKLGDHLQFLEPSAGKGRIVEAIRRMCSTIVVDAYEINPDFRQSHLLGLVNGACNVRNFLEVDPTHHCKYDAALMNPPFSRLQDIAHVLHAFQFLKPGGILVSIMSPAWTYRTDKRAAAFRDWFLTHHLPTWEMLPDNSFASSGTNVRTGMLTVVRG